MCAYIRGSKRSDDDVVDRTFRRLTQIMFPVRSLQVIELNDGRLSPCEACARIRTDAEAFEHNVALSDMPLGALYFHSALDLS